MDKDELLLIEKSQSGDIYAFETLIEKYQKKVYNIALRMMNNPEDASELSQEAFIRVYKSMKKFKGNSSFSTWIYRIVTNVCLDEIRKRKNKKVVSLDEEINLKESSVKRQVEDNRPTPDVVAEKKEVKKIVVEAINQLSEQHKTVIVLRDIQGLSYEETAKILNCPEGTVKSRINRARKALKDILESKKELLSEEYVKVM